MLKLNKIKILITGGNGYIAKSLYKAYKDIYDVTSITRKDLDLTNGEAIIQWFKDKYFDVVVHCASNGGSRLKGDTFADMDRNLCMYYNLLQCQSHYNKFIHFGSGAELLQRDTPYGLSKYVIRQSILEKNRFYNIRIYGVFDENELDTRFVKSNIKRYINKEPMLIQDKRMSFFYMKDLITLVDHHIQTPPSSLLKESSCAYTNSTTLLDIANIINELDIHKVPIYTDVQPGVDYESTLNAPYGLKYVGLRRGILDTYNKLKNEY
jgi:dTDP-4-dehydrorhamnose reductase